MNWWTIAYAAFVIGGPIIVFLYWFMNRPIVDMSGPSPGITAMLFEDDK